MGRNTAIENDLAELHKIRGFVQHDAAYVWKTCNDAGAAIDDLMKDPKSRDKGLAYARVGGEFGKAVDRLSSILNAWEDKIRNFRKQILNPLLATAQKETKRELATVAEYVDASEEELKQGRSLVTSMQITFKAYENYSIHGAEW